MLEVASLVSVGIEPQKGAWLRRSGGGTEGAVVRVGKGTEDDGRSPLVRARPSPEFTRKATEADGEVEKEAARVEGGDVLNGWP